MKKILISVLLAGFAGSAASAADFGSLNVSAYQIKAAAAANTTIRTPAPASPVTEGAKVLTGSGNIATAVKVFRGKTILLWKDGQVTTANTSELTPAVPSYEGLSKGRNAISTSYTNGVKHTAIVEEVFANGKVLIRWSDTGTTAIVNAAELRLI